MRKTSFAKFVKQARTSADLTQGAVAAVWGKSQATVSDVERGVVKVDREDIPMLAVALQCPVNDVLDAAGYKPITEPQKPARMKITEGLQAEVFDRDGDEELALDVTPEVRDILVGIARMQKAVRNQGSD